MTANRQPQRRIDESIHAKSTDIHLLRETQAKGYLEMKANQRRIAFACVTFVIILNYANSIHLFQFDIVGMRNPISEWNRCGGVLKVKLRPDNFFPISMP